MGKRQEAKAERRSRIINAAREMIVESGEVGFSMRSLAERAGVSPMTLYNLMDSRQAVLLGVLKEHIDSASAQYLSLSSTDSLANILGIIPFIRERLEEKPAFWRAVYQSFFEKGAGELRQVAISARVGVWEDLIQRAVDDGTLRKDADASLIMSTLNSIYLYNVFELAVAQASFEELEAKSQLGFIILLMGVSTSKSRARLEDLFVSQQKRVRAICGARTAVKIT